MDTTELILLLSEVSGIGEKSLAAILRRNAVIRRSPEAFLALPAAQIVEEYGLRAEAAALLIASAQKKIPEVAATARQLRRAGVQVLSLLDATYPSRLLEMMDVPPPILYAYGALDLLDEPLFVVANSNGASEEALTAGDRAAIHTMEAGWFPVTGHNRLAYQRPALAAKRRDGRICYVLDRGLLDAFDGDLSRELFTAAHIWSVEYDPRRDLTLSPFPLRAHSLAVHNRRRDSLIFALAQAVFIGEVRAGGQMERQCEEAARRGTPVYLIGPDRGEDNSLLEAGAMRSSEEALSHMLPVIQTRR